MPPAAKKTTRKKVARKRPAAKKWPKPGAVLPEPAPKVTHVEMARYVHDTGAQPRLEVNYEWLRRAVRNGNSIESCSAMAGIGRSTLWQHIERDPEMRRIYDQACAERSNDVLVALKTAAMRGSVKAQIFLAKNWCGLREVKAVELTGVDGGPIQITQELVPQVEGKLEEFIASRANGAAKGGNGADPESVH